MINEDYSFLCVFPFFHRIDSSFMEPTSLYASIAVNKADKRAQIKFRLQPSFMIRPYKVIKFFVQMQASSFLFFHIFLCP